MILKISTKVQHFCTFVNTKTASSLLIHQKPSDYPNNFKKILKKDSSPPKSGLEWQSQFILNEQRSFRDFMRKFEKKGLMTLGRNFRLLYLFIQGFSSDLQSEQTKNCSDYIKLGLQIRANRAVIEIRHGEVKGDCGCFDFTVVNQHDRTNKQT